MKETVTTNIHPEQLKPPDDYHILYEVEEHEGHQLKWRDFALGLLTVVVLAAFPAKDAGNSGTQIVSDFRPEEHKLIQLGDWYFRILPKNFFPSELLHKTEVMDTESK